MQILITTEDGNLDNPVDYNLVLDAFINKTNICYMNTMENGYDKVYLEKSKNMKMNTKFLNILNSIDYNIQNSYLSSKYIDAYYSVIDRHIKGCSITNDAKIFNEETKEFKKMKGQDLKLIVTDVSRTLLNSLEKLNKILISTNDKLLKPINANSDNEFIKKVR